MSLPRYSSYKDSGVEWLGEMPSHWSVEPFFSVASERKEPNIGMIEDNLLSLSYGRIVNKDITANDGLLPESFETYQVVHPNDIVFRLTDLQNDKRSLRTAIVKEKGIITSAYVAARPNKINSHYLNYLLRAYDKMMVFYSMGGGLRQSMKYADIKRLPTLLPSADEQAAIADFLDRETGKIDALVAEQERLIALLTEKRQAVISHAVTKGLNPTAPMKPSGIDWLGDIPAHWQAKRLRFLCQIETGDGDTADADDDAVYPFFVRSQTIERIDRYTHDCEAVLTAGDGAGVGKVFHHYKGKFCAHQRVYIFKDFRSISARFFFHYMRELFMRLVLEGTAKSTVDSLRRPMIADFVMTVPPDDEQSAIIKYVETQANKFDLLIAESSKAIEILQERRTALISAAVTGKINVRGQARKEKAA